MNHNGRRPDRVAELMQRKLAHLIQHEVDDSRLPQWMTILAVDISKDLAYARVYFTAISETPDDVVALLNESAPFLRTALARNLSLRKVPKLTFVYDTSVEYGKRLTRLIDDANASDERDEPNA
jgi:ribosome-binding factor A